MHRAACGRASGLRGRAKVFGGEWIMRSAGVRRREEGVKKCSGRACAVRGRAEIFSGEWVVRAAGLTHIRRSSSRTRVLLYIRPPCLRREIAAMGLKDAPCTHPSPAKPSAPAPSTFALPRPRSHFPRPHSHFSRIAFRGPRRAIGIPQQQLSTMGYPRKSYPHRCPPSCAKRSRPRACARVYIIYRSPVGRSRGVSAPLCPRVPRRRAQGGGGRRQRRTPPRAVPNHAACVPNHCVQRRSAQGQPRFCPCALPAATCLRPSPAR